MDELEAAKAAQNLKSISPDNLYRIELYNDPGAGKVEMHVPVDVEGNVDAGRSPKFFSSIDVNVDGSRASISFEIKDVRTIAGAIAAWPVAAVRAGKLAAESVIGARTAAVIGRSGRLEKPS